MVAALLLLFAASGGDALAGRTLLGVHGGWAAFRDRAPLHCYAVAEPVRASGRGSYLAVGYWPASGNRPQVQVHLGRAPAAGQSVTLAVGERRFPMVAAGPDAWTPDRRLDLAIVAAMRSGSSLSVEGRGAGGGAFADGYRLVGAATAIDAAAVGCAGQ